MTDFYAPPSKQHLKREREKARRLKSSKWWQQKLNEKTCYYCQKPFLPKELTMDHKVPLARGGMSSKSNLVTACQKCNTNKATQTSVDVALNQLHAKRDRSSK